MPKLSILMPVYNEGSYIKEALNSILAQSFTNFEAIVVDDGSTDDTRVKANYYASKDSRITVLTHGKIGKNAALNLAFNSCKGEIIMFLAGDDILPEDSLQSRVKAFEMSDPLTEKVSVHGHLKLYSKWPKYDGLVLPKKLQKGSSIGGATTFSRALAKYIFPLPTCLPNEDTWSSLCVQCFAQKQVVIEPIVLFYRIHEGNARKKGLPFDETNLALHERFIAYRLFLDQHEDELSFRNQKLLERRAKLEEFRYNGRICRILSMSKISLEDRLRALFYSNERLYKFKVKFDRFFLGH
jgi:glycosyltransferase involved in cell wall biosynthesis